MTERKYKNDFKGSLCLVMAAFIWGSSLVAQKSGMDYIGPATFTAFRTIIAGLALLPLTLFIGKSRDGNSHAAKTISKSATIKGGICCGIACGAAMLVQQYGVAYTSVGKAGFITALYIIIIPLMGMMWKKFPEGKVWISVAIAVAGLYLMSMSGGFSKINFGDLMMFLSAILLSVHFYVIDYFTQKADPVKMSCIQFFVVGIICTPIMLIGEPLNIEGLISCIIPLLYAGICSNALGYTLQIIGQRTVEPTKACLLMSSESIFSLLAGMVIMGELLTMREYLGCGLMFAAIIISQLPNRKEKC